MKFFADHCVPTSIIHTLRTAGHEVILLRDCIPINSRDEVVIAKAQELNAILVSLNGDFSDIVMYPPANYRGIIALQVRNHPEIIPWMMDRLTKYLSAHPDLDHYKGRLFLVEVHRIRVRE